MVLTVQAPPFTRGFSFYSFGWMNRDVIGMGSLWLERKSCLVGEKAKEIGLLWWLCKGKRVK